MYAKSHPLTFLIEIIFLLFIHSSSFLAPTSQLNSNKICLIHFLNLSSIGAGAELQESLKIWNMWLYLAWRGPLKLEEKHMLPAESDTYSYRRLFRLEEPIFVSAPGLAMPKHIFFFPRWKAPCAGLQSQWGVVRGADQERAGLGPQQLHHPGEQLGEAFLVSRTGVTERCRVPPEQRHQRQLPGAGEREQPGAAVHLAQVRRTRLPLQDQHHLGRQGEDLWTMLWGEEMKILIKRWCGISRCRLLRERGVWQNRSSINVKEHVCQGFGGNSSNSTSGEVQTVLVWAESSWVARQLWLEVVIAFHWSP